MTAINLLDAVFAHDVGSVAGKPPSYFTWNRLEPKPQQVDGITVFTDSYIFHPAVDEIQSPIKIGWLREPECLWPRSYEFGHKGDLLDKFDFILTCHQPLIDATTSPLNGPRRNKFRFAPYGGVWLPRDTWGIKPKTKNISMLIGSKMSTDGHRLRHEIYQALQDNGLADQVDFYGIHGTPVDYGWQTKYKVLADYRYTIVTETCRQDNLFTEILLDPLMVGTIPIFWGCPNLRDYFDSQGGVCFFEDATDLIDQIRHGFFDPGDYGDYLIPAYNNMLDARQYEITEDWLWRSYFKEMV